MMRLGVGRGAEVQAARRHAADHARLGGQREQVEHCSSLATLAMPSGMPMPRLTTLFGLQLERRAPRDDLAFGPICIGGIDSHRHADFAAEGRVVRRRRRSASDARAGATTTQSTRMPGILTCRGFSVPRLGDPLDLHDDDAAGIARGHRDRQRFERQRLLLHRDVAVGVGGGAAHDRDIDRAAPCRTDTPRRRVSISSTRSSVVRALILPPPWRGSTKVPRPTRVDGARLAGGDVAEQVADHALRQVVGLDLVVDGELLQLRHRPQWPPITRLTSPRGRSG